MGCGGGFLVGGGRRRGVGASKGLGDRCGGRWRRSRRGGGRRRVLRRGPEWLAGVGGWETEGGRAGKGGKRTWCQAGELEDAEAG